MVLGNRECVLHRLGLKVGTSVCSNSAFMLNQVYALVLIDLDSIPFVTMSSVSFI